MPTPEATIESLRRWSLVLLWVSVILPVFGALSAGARYYVERYEKRLSGKLTADAIQKAGSEASAARAEASEARGAQQQISTDLIDSRQQLEQLRKKAAPRHLTNEQHASLLESFKTLKGQPVAVACRMMDGESCDFARQIMAVLKEAGCEVPNLIMTAVNDSPGYVVVSKNGQSTDDVANAIVNALTNVGISARREDIPTNLMGVWYQNTVHIIVGRKAS
jgi:hypothetical protein